jgi:excisionase family DNA binding protein
VARRRHRLDPRRAKVHYSYTVAEAAVLLGVHRNTVRHWIKAGLSTLRAGGLTLVLGDELRTFLMRRQARRRVHCPPGSMFCLKCRAARRPPESLLEVATITATTANLRSICPDCESLMHRRVSLARIADMGFGDLPPHAPPHAPNGTPAYNATKDQADDAMENIVAYGEPRWESVG